MVGTGLFEWSDAMSVGIAEIDDQHKTLIGILNRLFVSVVQRDSDDLIVEILDALVDYTKTHFELEERLMLDSGYDSTEFAEHRRAHLAFIHKVGETATKNLVEGKSVSFELINFLKHWLRDHILLADRKYAEALLRSGYSTKAWTSSARAAMLAKQEVAPKSWWKVW
jgi:hemerythrin